MSWARPKWPKEAWHRGHQPFLSPVIFKECTSVVIQYLHTPKYAFPLSTRTLEPGVTQILVGNPRHRPRPCVEILVSRKTTAVLEGVMYASTCSTVPLQPSTGTVEMVKAALKYVCNTYPHVKRFELADETHVRTPSGMQYITPRRLLSGKPGYFQEHFGAEPSATTRSLLRDLHRPEPTAPVDASYDAICDRTKAMGLRSGCLFGTTWTIARATVDAYDINPTVATTGGGRTASRHNTWLVTAVRRPGRLGHHELSALDAGL